MALLNYLANSRKTAISSNIKLYIDHAYRYLLFRFLFIYLDKKIGLQLHA